MNLIFFFFLTPPNLCTFGFGWIFDLEQQKQQQSLFSLGGGGRFEVTCGSASNLPSPGKTSCTFNFILTCLPLGFIQIESGSCFWITAELLNSFIVAGVFKLFIGSMNVINIDFWFGFKSPPTTPNYRRHLCDHFS